MADDTVAVFAFSPDASAGYLGQGPVTRTFVRAVIGTIGRELN